MLIFIIIFYFFNSKLISKSIIDTLIFCFEKLIPSIFPLMIVCSIISESKIIDNLSNEKKSKIFGVLKNDVGIVISSWISGFLIGPRLLFEKYGEEDLTDYALLTSNAGIGFVVSYIGISLWNNIYWGIFLYISQLLVSLLIFKISKTKVKNSYSASVEKKSISDCIVKSVQSSTKTMLDICSYTIFFTFVKEIIILIIADKNNLIFSCILSCIFEISSGCKNTILLDGNILCGILTGFCVGFGGICMCFQTFSVCKVNKLKFTVKKLLQGIIVGILSGLFILFFDISLTENVSYVFKQYPVSICVVINTMFIFLLCLFAKKWLKVKIIKNKY